MSMTRRNNDIINVPEKGYINKCLYSVKKKGTIAFRLHLQQLNTLLHSSFH